MQSFAKIRNSCTTYPHGYNCEIHFHPFVRMTSDATPQKPIIIDVRSPLEYASGHVEGSVNLPLDRFVEAYAAVIQDKAKQVVVYCASGARSSQAVQFLMAQGYANAVNGISCHNVANRLGKSVV